MLRNKLGAQIIGSTLGVLILLAACDTLKIASTPTLTLMELAALNPSSRAYASMAYDIESDRVIMFGGQTGNYSVPTNISNETWAYDLSTKKWSQMKPTADPGRKTAGEMAYDAESDRVILFGGASGYPWSTDETWAYDYNTNTWTAMNAKGPKNHIGVRLAYDVESDRIILFGGCGISGANTYDTWVYDFNSDTWTEMKPNTSPPPRNYQAMAYNSKADKVLVWGGIRSDKSIWAYDFNTNTWQEIKPTQDKVPQLNDYPVMVYDNQADRTILVGGIPQGQDAWSYDYNTNTWTELKFIPVSSGLSRHNLVYSTAADQVILFGGQRGDNEFMYSGQTWAYNFNANSWTDVTTQP